MSKYTVPWHFLESLSHRQSSLSDLTSPSLVIPAILVVVVSMCVVVPLFESFQWLKFAHNSE